MSMDICAQMLHDRALKIADLDIQTMQIRPPFQWRLKHLQKYIPQYFNGDRFLNRFVDYPQYLRSHSPDYDLFHVADHSYAHLINGLPADRTGVYCHDADAFRSILAPEREPRSWAFRHMSQHILTGLQKAAIVFHPTQEIGRQLAHYQLVDPALLVVAPPGVSPEYQSQALPAEPKILALQHRLQGKPFILHVGSCIPRKRIDVLLATFAALRAELPQLQLVKVGGKWTDAQQQQIDKLALAESIVHLTDLQNSTIAQLHQQAAIVLMTSDAEGFGMPIIEALACGAIVLASDIPVMREVGDDAVVYCPVGDIETWIERTLAAITTPDRAPAIDRRLAVAARYTWENYARTIMAAYAQLAAGKF